MLTKPTKPTNFRPKKFLGQNFLVDRKVLYDIIEAAELKTEDTVVEIGPGFGVLTEELAKRVKKVIAIEKDERLVKILKDDILKETENVKIIRGDILKLKFQITNSKIQINSKLQIPKYYKVVANLPYYITSPVIRKYLEAENPPELMVLMVQKEVAERICALPPEMSLLAVACQLYSKPEIVRIVKKECFWPAPKVDGAVIKIVPRKSAYSIGVNQLLFFRIVKAGFSSPRKQLKNNLKKIFGEETDEILNGAGIEPSRRAETLTIEEWIKIYDMVK